MVAVAMSDQLPRSDYDGLIRMSGDAMWNEGYAAGVQDSMLRATQIERVLTDLIGVLRDEHRPYQGCAHECCRECTTCRETWPCETSQELDRAETRLREVQGE